MLPLPIRSALATVLYLPGGLIAAFLAGSLINLAFGHASEAAGIAVAAAFALAVTGGAGALWGRSMAALTGAGESRRLSWAGALSFGPGAITAGLVLSLLENIIVQQGRGPSLPVHQVFTMLFVPTVFAVAGLGGLALGLALKSGGLAARLALASSSSGAAAFLVINLLMDSLGWRVGAPRAAERATMITVLIAGDGAAA